MSPASDDQWPRYQVFHQKHPEEPHVNAGSVHAPDAEMALQNARDVFVRRPECSSLWVAPASDIHSMTAQERQDAARSIPQVSSGPVQTYLVFEKRMHIGSHEYSGQVEAGSPAEALRLAAAADGERPALVWWVVPKDRVLATGADEQDSMFGPALDKDYRGQAAFRTTTMMRKMRQEAAGSDD